MIIRRRIHRLIWAISLMMTLTACLVGVSSPSNPAVMSDFVLTATALQVTPVANNVTPTFTLAHTIITPSKTPPPPTVTASITPTLAPSNTPVPTDTPESLINEHIVRQGDTLIDLSLRYGVPMSQIAQANNLNNWTHLPVGFRVLIPSDDASFPTPTPLQVISLNQLTTPLPTSLPMPEQINGISLDDFLVMNEDVITNVRAIYARGQLMGRDGRVFALLGDSTIEPPHFFIRFDRGRYHLGDYTALQRTIDHFAGSFDHNSVAIVRGLQTWLVFDPFWVSGGCDVGQGVLECEIARKNPSLLFIRLGSNDRGVPESTDKNLRRIVNYAIDEGIIPILTTKSDRAEGVGDVNNNIIRTVADDLNVPLWDYDLLASTLPNRGLDFDSVHMTTFFAHDWRLERGFTSGHGIHNLSALMVLDALRQIIVR